MSSSKSNKEMTCFTKKYINYEFEDNYNITVIHSDNKTIIPNYKIKILMESNDILYKLKIVYNDFFILIDNVIINRFSIPNPKILIYNIKNNNFTINKEKDTNNLLFTVDIPECNKNFKFCISKSEKKMK